MAERLSTLPSKTVKMIIKAQKKANTYRSKKNTNVKKKKKNTNVIKH